MNSWNRIIKTELKKKKAFFHKQVFVTYLKGIFIKLFLCVTEFKERYIHGFCPPGSTDDLLNKVHLLKNYSNATHKTKFLTNYYETDDDLQQLVSLLRNIFNYCKIK